MTHSHRDYIFGCMPSLSKSFVSSIYVMLQRYIVCMRANKYWYNGNLVGSDTECKIYSESFMVHVITFPFSDYKLELAWYITRKKTVYTKIMDWFVPKSSWRWKNNIIWWKDGGPSYLESKSIHKNMSQLILGLIYCHKTVVSCSTLLSWKLRGK